MMSETSGAGDGTLHDVSGLDVADADGRLRGISIARAFNTSSALLVAADANNVLTAAAALDQTASSRGGTASREAR